MAGSSAGGVGRGPRARYLTGRQIPSVGLRTHDTEPTVTETIPAVDGWFTAGPEPRLLGLRCGDCGTTVFPPRAPVCPNPSCRGEELSQVELSRTGTVWSYATNHYPPPPPYEAADPYEPTTVVAVELGEEELVVLGQLDGDPADIEVGTRMELTTGTLFTDDEGEHIVWKWRRASAA